MLFNELPFLQRHQAAADHRFVGLECLFAYGVNIDGAARVIH